MCDTLVAVGTATLNGAIIFAKNSDRPPNESQPLVHQPRLIHHEASVKCQNLEIPQADLTFEHIGSRPYWLWGYEHGLNEFGVAIGNLAVFSKEPYEEPVDKAGLLGMDLVRLGLERSRNAHEAVKVITGLLEEHGPGYCTRPSEVKYNNNYLIADPTEAWALETAGRYWASKRITDGVCHLGNLYSIETSWDECHQNLVDHAIETGWCSSREYFNFAKAYGDYLNSEYPTNMMLIRYQRGVQLLNQHIGKITPVIMMEILRDHLEGTFLEPPWAAGENFYPTICLHEAPWMSGQTAASMVVELRKDMTDLMKAQCWSCLTAPCTSVFMPLYPNIMTPENLSIAGKRYLDTSPWWTFKRLQRHTEKNYPIFGNVVRNVWRETEKRMMDQRSIIEREALGLIENEKKDEAISLLQSFVDSCCEKAIGKAIQLDNLLYDLEKTGPKYRDLREEYLNSLNNEVKMDITRST